MVTREIINVHHVEVCQCKLKCFTCNENNLQFTFEIKTVTVFTLTYF